MKSSAESFAFDINVIPSESRAIDVSWKKKEEREKKFN